MVAISDKLALEIIRKAFLPLHCGAEVYDYEEKIRFRVVNGQGETILDITNLRRSEFSDSDQLERILNGFREDLADHRGIFLDPWAMQIRLI